MWEQSSLTVAYLTLLNINWKVEEPHNRTLCLIYPPLALLHWRPRAAPMACHLVELPAAGVATARCTLHHGILYLIFMSISGRTMVHPLVSFQPMLAQRHVLRPGLPGSWIITGGVWKWIFPQVLDGWGHIDLGHMKWGVREAQNPALNNSSTLWNMTGTTGSGRAGWENQSLCQPSFYCFNGHELGQTLGDSKGQGSLVCCSPWGRKESDTTEWLNNTTTPSAAMFLERSTSTKGWPSEQSELCLWSILVSL